MTAHQGLLDLLDELRERVAEAVAVQRALEADPDDPYRGLYVGDDHVDRVLNGPEIAIRPPMATPNGDGSQPLDVLARRAGLTPIDIGILVAALAPDLDPGFEKLYVYLNDDITRRRASVGLALRLAGASPVRAEARRRLLAGAPLIDLHLAEVEDIDRPFLTRSLRVPDRVLQHLLGDDALPAEIEALVVNAAGWPDDAEVRRLVKVFQGGVGLLHLHDPGEAGGLDLGLSVSSGLGTAPLCIDLSRAPAQGVDPDLVIRELVLRGCGLVVANGEQAKPDLLRGFVERAPAAIIVSRDAWNPSITGRPAVCEEVRAASCRVRRQAWSDAMASIDPTQLPFDPSELDALRISPSAIHRSVRTAARLADLSEADLSLAHIRDGARLQASPRLARLARRIKPGVDWGDLVLTPSTRAELELLAVRIRRREIVLDEWGLRRRSGHADGVTALFAGASGTGKTLAAEVVASELGLELYVIDLSTVVDKYVGETEKNLEQIFAQAEGVNGVLFFDEADALFGKRSEVSDARDRYANTEIAYLLQRIEQFDGLAILATNLKANVDEAFLRRLAVVVDFPEPDRTLRRRLWELHIGSIPSDDDLDLDFLSRAFTLSGGNIRNISVTAAFIASARDGRLRMADIVQAVGLEYRKLGRLCDPSEFGPWTDVAARGWRLDTVEVA